MYSSLAREAIRSLLADKQIAPHNDDYHHNKCNFVKTANFIPPVVEKKEAGKAPAEKKGGKK
jgi:hypothetical protein